MKNMKIIKTVYGNKEITIFEKEIDANLNEKVELIAIHVDYESISPKLRDMFFLTVEEAKQLVDILTIEINAASK